LITERLLAREAARRGISVQALLDAEVAARVEPVSEQEIEIAYRALKDQLVGDEAAKQNLVRARLSADKLAARRRTFLESLRSQAHVVIHLETPPVARAEVTADGAPAKGPAAAPVTVV